MRAFISKHHNRLVFGFFLLIALALYRESLLADYFHFDDKIAVQDNPYITAPFDLAAIWQGFNTRFLVGWSFALNRAFLGNNPLGFRLVNLIIHAFNAFLVFRFISLCAGELKRDSLTPAAGLAALIFLVHPLQTEPVNFITQRFVLLLTTFYLAALIQYLLFRVNARRRYFFTALVCGLAAMFTKEAAVTLPGMLIALEGFILPAAGVPLRQRVRWILPFALLALIVPLVLLRTGVQISPVARIAAYQTGPSSPEPMSVDISRAAGASLSRTEYFWTEMKVLVTYLRLFAVPVGQNVDHDVTPARYVLSAGVIPSALLLLSLLVAAVVLRKTYPLAALGVIWFFWASSVESSFIPIGHVMSEYRLYLPGVGLALTAAVFLVHALRRRPRWLLAVGIAVCFILSGLTLRRNTVWSDQVWIWKDALLKSPAKIRPYVNLAEVYLERGDFDKAGGLFRQAITLEVRADYPYYGLCRLYSKKKQYPRALSYGLKALALNPGEARYQRQVGYILTRLGDVANAIPHYKAYFMLAPSQESAFEYTKVLFKFFEATGDNEKVMEYARVMSDYGYGPFVDMLADNIETAGGPSRFE